MKVAEIWGWRRLRVWNGRALGGTDIVHLPLDSNTVRTPIDREAMATSHLVAIAVRRDGQKVLLDLGGVGGESTAVWTAFFEGMERRGPSVVRTDPRPCRPPTRGP